MSDTVTVHVTCLGPLAAALSREPIDVTCEPIARAALGDLANRFPAVAELLGRVALATDAGYLTKDAPLTHGMQLLLVPPVSGG